MPFLSESDVIFGIQKAYGLTNTWHDIFETNESLIPIFKPFILQIECILIEIRFSICKQNTIEFAIQWISTIESKVVLICSKLEPIPVRQPSNDRSMLWVRLKCVAIWVQLLSYQFNRLPQTNERIFSVIYWRICGKRCVFCVANALTEQYLTQLFIAFVRTLLSLNVCLLYIISNVFVILCLIAKYILKS